jgi:hypothetical protein
VPRAECDLEIVERIPAGFPVPFALILRQTRPLIPRLVSGSQVREQESPDLQLEDPALAAASGQIPRVEPEASSAERSQHSIVPLRCV